MKIMSIIQFSMLIPNMHFLGEKYFFLLFSRFFYFCFIFQVRVGESFAFHTPCPISMKFTSLMQFLMLIPNMILNFWRNFISYLFSTFFMFPLLGLVRLGQFHYDANYMTNAIFHADSKYAFFSIIFRSFFLQNFMSLFKHYLQVYCQVWLGQVASFGYNCTHIQRVTVRKKTQRAPKTQTINKNVKKFYKIKSFLKSA